MVKERSNKHIKEKSYFIDRLVILSCIFIIPVFVAWYFSSNKLRASTRRAIQLNYPDVDNLKVHFDENGDLKLWSIPDFLPVELANDLFNELNSYWDANNNSWLYTTNYRGTNKKVSNNQDISLRKGSAMYFYRNGRFSYSKYELNRKLDIVSDIFNYMNSTQLMNIIGNLLDIELDYVSDLFVSCFKYQDFLAIHEDYSLGSLAFVLSLTKNWTSGDGGFLRFRCRHDQRDNICKRIKPSFNTLNIFRTRPRLIPHDVSLVLAEKNRYAITGWIVEQKDSQTKEQEYQVKLQRG